MTRSTILFAIDVSKPVRLLAHESSNVLFEGCSTDTSSCHLLQTDFVWNCQDQDYTPKSFRCDFPWREVVVYLVFPEQFSPQQNMLWFRSFLSLVIRFLSVLVVTFFCPTIQAITFSPIGMADLTKPETTQLFSTLVTGLNIKRDVASLKF